MIQNQIEQTAATNAIMLLHERVHTVQATALQESCTAVKTSSPQWDPSAFEPSV